MEVSDYKKMLTDGTNVQGLGNSIIGGYSSADVKINSSLYVIGDWIYSVRGKRDTAGMQFVEMKPTGTRTASIEGDTIYYYLDGAIPTINKTSTYYGTEETLLNLDKNDQVIRICNGFVYIRSENYAPQNL